LPLDTTAVERIVAENGRHAKDTGSAEVQIALLTARIEELTRHLQTFKQDNHSRRGLLKLVGQRRRLLTFLKRDNAASYLASARSSDFAANPELGNSRAPWL